MVETKRSREMRRLLARHGRSGLTLSEFARRECMVPATLYWWRRQLRAEITPPPPVSFREASRLAALLSAEPLPLLRHEFQDPPAIGCVETRSITSPMWSCHFSTGSWLVIDDGRAQLGAVLEDLEEVAAVLLVDGHETPVVEDRDVEACEPGEQPGVGAIGAGTITSDDANREGEPQVRSEAGQHDDGSTRQRRSIDRLRAPRTEVEDDRDR